MALEPLAGVRLVRPGVGALRGEDGGEPAAEDRVGDDPAGAVALRRVLLEQQLECLREPAPAHPLAQLCGRAGAFGDLDQRVDGPRPEAPMGQRVQARGAPVVERPFGAAQEVPGGAEEERLAQVRGPAQRRPFLEALQEHGEVPGIPVQPLDEERGHRLGPADGPQLLLDPSGGLLRVERVEPHELELAEEELKPLPEDGARPVLRGAGEDEEDRRPRHHALAQLMEGVPEPQFFEEQELVQDEQARLPPLLHEDRDGVQRTAERLPVEPAGQKALHLADRRGGLREERLGARERSVQRVAGLGLPARLGRGRQAARRPIGGQAGLEDGAEKAMEEAAAGLAIEGAVDDGEPGRVVRQELVQLERLAAARRADEGEVVAEPLAERREPLAQVVREVGTEVGDGHSPGSSARVSFGVAP